MSTLGERIRNAREEKGLLQSQLAKLIGVRSSGVISNWEKDINKPDADRIVKLCNVLGVSASYLLDYYGKTSFEVTQKEKEIVEKYRSLDESGQAAIDWQLEHETARVAALREFQSKQIPRRIFAYYGKIAAAGTWVEFSDLIAGTKEYYLTDENVNADYTIGVNGDSMEPTYFDGDVVFVKSTTNLNVGDVGIFQKDNSIYIKEVGKDGLISHNPKYPPMTNGGDVQCLGKVVGKVTEDMIIEK